MASLFQFPTRSVRLLDAGAGAGALTKAIVSRLCLKKDRVLSIEATLYEVDPSIQEALEDTMHDCQRMCSVADIQFGFTIHAANFIQESAESLADLLFDSKTPAYDIAIVNPPYRKIGMHSPERQWLSQIGIETTNLYAGFIAIIQRLLAPNGQLVGITPRSFCNGPYFRPFREDFLANLEIHWIHVFESRGAAFSDDGVLQENIIFHAVKGKNQPPELVISTSSGKPGDSVTEKQVPFTEVVHENDTEKFIHIPSTAGHSKAKKSMEGLHTPLAALGVSVSTGRVVDFRMKDALRRQPEKGAVPLLYPCHFSSGTIHWPKPNARKPDAILDTSETRPWLVSSGVYLLTKRFTSKEERRRLVACLFDPKEIETKWLGIENHLNYFHADGQGLDRNLAMGLFAYLNSTMVDQYFRSFSGNTQVNATDLRNLVYPDRPTLVAMGSEMKNLCQPQEVLDKLVEKHLGKLD